MFLNVGLPMGAVCWTLPPRICCITPLKVCSIWLALISISKWFYNSTQVSNIKTHTDDPQMPLFPNKIKKYNITKRHHSTQLSLKISLPNKICFPQNPSQASLPPHLTVTTFFPSTPRPRPLKVICTVTKPKQSTELLGPTPSKYMALRLANPRLVVEE